MNRDGKDAFIADLKEAFASADAAFFIRTIGLPVSKFNSLRRRLRSSNARLQVGKARLLKKALEGLCAGSSFLSSIKGQLAVVLSREDSTTVAKSIFDFKIQNKDQLELVSGIYQGKCYDAIGFEALARIPSKPVLCGMLAQVLQQNIARLARALNEVVKVKSAQ